jgi:ferredoxin
MPSVTFIQPDGAQQTIDAPENHSLMQIAIENKIAGITGICGGVMACATCHVLIHPDWVERVTAADNEKTEEEDDTLDTAFHTGPTSRLGCQIRVTKALDGLIVALPTTQTPW